jgi:hypothetical protein
MTWYDDLEHDLGDRESDPTKRREIADKIWTAVTKTMGEPGESALVHAVDIIRAETETQDRIAFLIVDQGLWYLIEFEPPAKTSVSFLGSMHRGRYREIVEHSEDLRIEGIFGNRRLFPDRLRVALEPVAGFEHTVPRPGTRRAKERTQELRKLLREWAMEPEPPNSP